MNELSIRDVIRCEHCCLVQYETITGKCRRCDQDLPPVIRLDAPAQCEPEEPRKNIYKYPIRPQVAVPVSFPELHEIGRRTFLKREEVGLTQDAVARAGRLPRTYISRIECGHLMPGIPKLLIVRSALSTSLDYLILGIDTVTAGGTEHDLPEFIVQLRHKAGLSQGDIQKRLGIGRSYWSRIENGYVCPSLHTLMSLRGLVPFSFDDAVGARTVGPKIQLTSQPQCASMNQAL